MALYLEKDLTFPCRNLFWEPLYFERYSEPQYYTSTLGQQGEVTIATLGRC